MGWRIMQEAASPLGNRLTSQEVDDVLTTAREMPELNCRQLAAWTTDNQGFSVWSIASCAGRVW